MSDRVLGPPIELPEAALLLKPLREIRPGKKKESLAARYGGKAATLAELDAAGYPVPDGWVIDAHMFETAVDRRLPKGHDIASLIKLAGTREGTDRAARARDRILADALPDELTTALAAAYGALEASTPWGLSVRSSATCEDARSSSLAGLATSILGVRGERELCDAVRQVWSSLYLPRTLLYLHRWNIRSVSMPVLIMPMVLAKAAGVLFT
ncbi:MAG: phosphoenolpyruvate synthase, partial [Myxococcales bacterium]|nr:phosphoenolpyruvate synthase [Myxococcales bacterium]